MSVFARRAEGAHVRIVGHRGGRGEGWPAENTMSAFERALAEGADAIELDVRTTADGVIVFHDEELTRMTNKEDTRKVANVSSRELARVKLRGDATMPTLTEVLDWARTRIAVNVEIKRDVPSRMKLTRDVAAIVRASGAEVIVSSFDPGILLASALLLPKVPHAQLVHAGQGKRGTYAAASMPNRVAKAVHFEFPQATSASVYWAHRCGHAVGVWTVNDPLEARRLVGLGVDWLITDRARAIRDAIAAN